MRVAVIPASEPESIIKDKNDSGFRFPPEAGKQAGMTKGTILVFVIFFVIFLLGQASIRGFWSHDDPYYHARHSALIAETGNLTLVRPWLTMHFLSYAPTDPWWGYHLLMAGFIHFFGPVWGSKVFSALLAALIFAVFYFILTRYKVRRPWLWTALFLGSSQMLLFRLLLERPHLLAPTALLLAWWLSRRKKYFWLFILFFVYTLLYHQSPLLLSVAAVQLAADYVFTRQWRLKSLISSLAGILAGILLHPQPLNYVYVMFIELWQVLYLNFTGANLNIGNELVTLPFGLFLQNNILPLIFYLVVLALFLSFRAHWRGRAKSELYGLGVISSFWFLSSLAVPRGAEYWLPLAWLFGALIITTISKTSEGEQLKNYLKQYVFTKITRPFVCIALVILLANNIIQLALAIREQNANLFPEQMQAAAEWLRDNTPAGSVVFYDNWSYWPIMFYYNQHNRYLTGMEPTFMYDYNSRLYWLWRNISQNGYVCEEADGCLAAAPRAQIRAVADVIRHQFQSEYVLVYNEPKSPIYRTLTTLKQDFQEVFRNERFLIFTPTPTGS